MESINILFVLSIGMILLGAIAALTWVMDKGINKLEKRYGKTMEQILRSWED